MNDLEEKRQIRTRLEELSDPELSLEIYRAIMKMPELHIVDNGILVEGDTGHRLFHNIVNPIRPEDYREAMLVMCQMLSEFEEIEFLVLPEKNSIAVDTIQWDDETTVESRGKNTPRNFLRSMFITMLLYYQG